MVLKIMNRVWHCKTWFNPPFISEMPIPSQVYNFLVFTMLLSFDSHYSYIPPRFHQFGYILLQPFISRKQNPQNTMSINIKITKFSNCRENQSVLSSCNILPIPFMFHVLGEHERAMKDAEKCVVLDSRNPVSTVIYCLVSYMI